MIYVDESGIDSKCHRKHCWCEKGKNIPTNNTGKEYIRTTIIGALRDGDKAKNETKKQMALLSFYGTTNKETFLFWLKKCLLPRIKKDDVIIMDNASIHKSIEVRKLIESKKARLIYQPPYSPFLNKIENYWAFLKSMLYNNSKYIDNFNDNLRYVCNLKYSVT
jgi:transposase